MTVCSSCIHEGRNAYDYPCRDCGDDGEFYVPKGNQEAKADAGKLRPTLVPTAAIRAIAAIRGYGVAKYPNGGPDNWKKVEPERYRDAMARHMLAYIDDPTGKDEESGLPHLWHLICNAAFLCELENFDV